jgi:hypothetical protein
MLVWAQQPFGNWFIIHYHCITGHSSVGVGGREMCVLPPAWGAPGMALYFFDMRVGATLLVEGLELPNLKAVQIEAARSLGELAQHALWTTAETILGHRMRVEVRDGTGPVLQATFTFEIERHKQ